MSKIVNVQENQVEAMFNGIAPQYDFLNHLLSFGIDKLWRKRLVKGVAKRNPSYVLDVATGTADLSVALARRLANVRIVGVDIAAQMLKFASSKLHRLGLEQKITLQKASSLSLPFDPNTFDTAMVAFGVRNFEDPLLGLSEMHRVLKPGGSIHILEFTTPRYKLIGWVYRFYFSKILPTVGRMVSGHKSAYTYLPLSVSAFKEWEAFNELLMQAGFENAQYKQQSLGVAAIYTATKPLANQP